MTAALHLVPPVPRTPLQAVHDARRAYLQAVMAWAAAEGLSKAAVLGEIDATANGARQIAVLMRGDAP